MLKVLSINYCVDYSNQPKLVETLITFSLTFLTIIHLSFHCYWKLFSIVITNLQFFICIFFPACWSMCRNLIEVSFSSPLLSRLAFFQEIGVPFHDLFSLAWFFPHNCILVKWVFSSIIQFIRPNFPVISICHFWVIQFIFVVFTIIQWD